MPTTIPIVSATDGARISVDTLLKNPRLIPRRIIGLLENEFIADQIFRPGGDAPGGAVEYFQNVPQFPAGPDAGVKSEFGEYPVVTFVDGLPQVAIALNRGFSMKISEDMRRRNQMDRVALQMKQGANLMIRTFNNVFQNVLIAAMNTPLAGSNVAVAGKLNGVGTTPVGAAFVGNTAVASAVWTGSGGSGGAPAGTIRHDILEAKRLIADQTVDGTSTVAGTSYLGFRADTIVMSEHDSAIILENNDFSVPLANSPFAKEQTVLSGEIPGLILGLKPYISRSWNSGSILICERGTVGFIADERPLQSTPMEYKSETEVWRNNTSRITAVACDQPLSGFMITGIQ